MCSRFREEAGSASGGEQRVRGFTHRAVSAILVIFLLDTLIAAAATYYVDAESGSDENDGDAPTAAWKSLARVNRAEFQSGDRILLRRGGRWPEALLVPSAGTESVPLVFGAYGEGPLPIIDGEGARNASVSVIGKPFVTLEDLDCRGWAQRGIYARDAPGIEIRRCAVSGGDGDSPCHGIQIQSLGGDLIPGVRIENNVIGTIGTGSNDTVFFCGITVQDVQGAVIAGNHIHPVHTAAIRLLRGSGAGNLDCRIERNLITGSYGGLMNFNSDRTLIRHNIIRDGAGLGIGIAYDSNEVVVFGNLIFNLAPSSHLWNGIDINHNCRNGRIYNNTVSAVHRHCLMLDAETGVSSGWEFGNNILDARRNTGSIRLPLGIRTLDGYASDYNLFSSANGDVATYGEIGPGQDGTVYGLADYRQLSGQDAHSKLADPAFAAPESGDFRLSSNSPAIDAGNSAAVPPDVTDLDGDGNLTESIPLDLDRRPRFFDDPHTPDAGMTVPPLAIVDMGPYEFAPSGGRFCGLQHSPDTGSTFLFCGATINVPYRIQASSSLTGDGWIDLADFTYAGPLMLSDAHAGSTPSRFFRAVTP